MNNDVLKYKLKQTILKDLRELISTRMSIMNHNKIIDIKIRNDSPVLILEDTLLTINLLHVKFNTIDDKIKAINLAAKYINYCKTK